MAKNSPFRVIIETGTVSGSGQRLMIIDNRTGDQPVRISEIRISASIATTSGTMDEKGTFRLYKAVSAASEWTNSDPPNNSSVVTRTSPYETAANTGDTRAVIYQPDGSMGGYSPSIVDDVHTDLIDIAIVTYDSPYALMKGAIVQIGEGLILFYDGDIIEAGYVVIEGVD